MKKLILAGIVSIAASSTIMAADLGPYKAAPAIAPVGYDWSGVYIGGHIGGGWQDTLFNEPSLTLFDAQSDVNQTTNSSSFLGGLQAGANYQIGRLVLAPNWMCRG
jgi:outer membrane immunogenic protein